jgi:hypothetical protein
MGFQSATTKGTTVTCAGSANTKGSYAQVTASTSYDYIGLGFALDSQALTSGNGAVWLMDIAIGAAASEKIILPDWAFAVYNQTSYLLPATCHPPFLPMKIPAGTRLSARCQSGLASASCGVTIYGVR